MGVVAWGNSFECLKRETTVSTPRLTPISPRQPRRLPYCLPTPLMKNRSKGDAPVEGRGFEPLRNVNWLARGKFGFEGALKFFKDDQHPQIPFDSVELTAGPAEKSEGLELLI